MLHEGISRREFLRFNGPIAARTLLALGSVPGTAQAKPRQLPDGVWELVGQSDMPYKLVEL
jgi:hypothetical protein